jgi:hypothetical protein
VGGALRSNRRIRRSGDAAGFGAVRNLRQKHPYQGLLATILRPKQFVIDGEIKQKKADALWLLG